MARFSFGHHGSLPYSWKRDNPDKVAAAQEAGFRFRSRPGAPHSPRDATVGVDYNPDTGFSSDSSWNAFFRPSRIASGLDTAPAPDPNAGQVQPQTGAAPEATLSSAELGTAPAVTPPTAPTQAPTSPLDRYKSVVDANLRYFNRKGIQIAPPSGAQPTQPGTSFVSRFGSGSVRSAASLSPWDTASRNLYGGMAPKPEDLGYDLPNSPNY